MKRFLMNQRSLAAKIFIAGTRLAPFCLHPLYCPKNLTVPKMEGAYRES
jgi:hypothetical protein